MLKRLVIASALLISLAHLRTEAQQPTALTRFLVPLYTADTPGAYGSLWQVRTFLHYAGGAESRVTPRAFCFGVMCPLEGRLEPHRPAVPFQHLAGFPEPAILVHVETAHASEVTFSSRIRDLSRATESAGTEIPVIREDRMSATPVYLLNVPVENRFRNMLRIYALPDVQNPEVELRYYRQPASDGPRIDLDIHLLKTQRVALRTRQTTDTLNLFPALTEIGNIELMPDLMGERTIWIEVAPMTSGMRIWALLSVTNNETQQITIVTPQNK